MMALRTVLLLLLSTALLVYPARIVDFQVSQPPPVPTDTKQCTTLLFEHTFGNSFGQPALAQVVPPTDCGPIGSWAGITLNLTCTSNGTQFDRLAIISFEGVEIWRSSTPEPSRGDGIIWTYIKDVTRYIPLLSQPGVLQLELDNLLSDSLGLDGQYDVTFSITYFSSSPKRLPAPKSDLIVGITNFTSVPGQFTAPVTLPRNTVEAYAEIYASGNGDEEFWYFNTANDFINDLPPNTSLPNGPFREVRILVDSQLAGVAFPYPVYFTGAITPNAWRPIASYGALDQPTYVVDLTPFVPIFADGQAHNISLDVLSAEVDHTTNQNWFVSALIQVITDSSSRPTTGKITVNQAPQFATTNTAGSIGVNGDVSVTVTASRSIHIEADVISGSGKRNHIVWKQQLTYSNAQSFLNNTTVQSVVQKSTGVVTSTHNGIPTVADQFNFPMEIDIVATPDFSNFSAKFDHSYIRTLLPSPFILGTTINNRQIASGAIFTLPSGARTGNGNNTNMFSYVDLKGNTFNRKVTAMLNNITQDVISGSLAGGPRSSLPFIAPPKNSHTQWAARLPGGKSPLVLAN